MQLITITLTRYHTRYRTFSFNLTWIGHIATRYCHFNVILRALPNILSQFNMI